MINKLPNFLLVGAAKSGTSSLHYYLNQHPDIYMPSYDAEGNNVKEPMFLVKNSVQGRVNKGVWTLEEYQKLFEKVTTEKAIGEATVFYLNFFEEAIPNIKKILGTGTKIILILRNPIERAYSAYHHTKRYNKNESLSFDEALIAEEIRYRDNLNISPMTLYKSMGKYFEMVKAYLENFENVKIILYDDFMKNSKITVVDVFKFLKVDENVDINFTIRKNVGGWEWKNNFVKAIYLYKGPIKKITKSVFELFPNYKQKVLTKLIENNKEPIPPMSSETREYLVQYFHKDVESLSLITGRDLSHWLK